MSSPYTNYTYLVVVNAHYLHQSYGEQTTADVFYAFSGRTTYVHVQSRRHTTSTFAAVLSLLLQQEDFVTNHQPLHHYAMQQGQELT